MKKFLSLLMAGVMLCATLNTLFIVPVSAYNGIDDWTYTNQGSCGEYCWWEYDQNGTLTILGEGMAYVEPDYYPWELIKGEVTSIIIENGVTSLGGMLFSDFYNLTNIEIPDSVTMIDWEVFSGCIGLTSITIPDSVTAIGVNSFLNTGYFNNEDNWENGVLYIDNWLVAEEGEFETYKIKDGCVGIADGAFHDYESLTSIEIPDSVTRIGNFAFDQCYGLTDVYYNGTEKEWQEIIKGVYLIPTSTIMHFQENIDIKEKYFNSLGNNRYEWKFEIVDNNEENLSGSLIVALYDDSYRVVGIKIVPINEFTYKTEKADEITTRKSPKYYKVFYWELLNLIPLALPVGGEL